MLIFRIYIRHAAILLATGLLFQLAAQDKPKRPRITGIDHVRLYVRSVDKSLAFYSSVLGLPTSGGGCSSVTRSCFPVNWYQQIELEQAPSPASKNWLAEIGFATDDVAGMCRYLLAHGVAAGEISSDRR